MCLKSVGAAVVVVAWWVEEGDAVGGLMLVDVCCQGVQYQCMVGAVGGWRAEEPGMYAGDC